MAEETLELYNGQFRVTHARDSFAATLKVRVAPGGAVPNFVILTEAEMKQLHAWLGERLETPQQKAARIAGKVTE